MSTPLSALKSPEEQPSLHHDEIAQLIREIHEERQAIKDRERAERWTIWVSLCIVVFAVFAAIGGQQDSSVSTSLVLLQSQASDTWAYYQAKAIKQRVALAELNGAGTPEQARAAVVAELDKLKQEARELFDKAKALEARRDLIGRKDGPLSDGVAALQVAIALASVCLIVKRRILWAASGVFGTLGVFLVLRGIFLV